MSSGSSTPASVASQFNKASESDNTSSDENVPPAFLGQPLLQKSRCLHRELAELFAENVAAKVWRTASTSFDVNALASPTDGTGSLSGPAHFPEIVPQDGPEPGRYVLREAEFWTCGFFPGTLYELLMRSIRYPQSILPEVPISGKTFRTMLEHMCRIWSNPLHDMASRTDTHDIGFIVMPALRLDWETTGNFKSLDSIIRAARSLATRYVASAGVIRSWDLVIKKDIVITDMASNVIVIIDSLCNLDLLFYAAAHAGDDSLAEIATTHARSLLRTHLRPEEVATLAKDGYHGPLYSTCHVANVDPSSGEVKQRFTAQGYDHDSTWARGQAWAILGYAQTYMWTKDPEFLEAACGVAEYFLYRMETLKWAPEVTTTQKYTTPPWDFDAPEDPNLKMIVRDSSSAFIAANGLLIMVQALNADRNYALATRFLEGAIDLVRGTLDFSLAQEKAKFETNPSGQEVNIRDGENGQRFDSILKHGTANNNANARRQYCNHGLVYGDYYLVQFGNRLLQMGLM